MKSSEPQTAACSCQRVVLLPTWKQPEAERLERGDPSPIHLPAWGGGEAPIRRVEGGDTESHRHSPTMALGTPEYCLSLAQNLYLNQTFVSSLMMWPGVGPHGRGRAGEESRAESKTSRIRARGKLKEQSQAHKEPATPVCRQGPGHLGAFWGASEKRRWNAGRLGAATVSRARRSMCP